MSAAGRILIDTSLDTKGLQKELSGLDKAVKAGLKTVVASIAAAGTTIAGFGMKIGSAGFQFNKEMEQLNASFEVMLGSAEKAVELTEDLRQMGAATPFEATDLAKATQTLLAFGSAQEDILPQLQMLGDISLGNKEKLQGLSVVFGQIQSTGRLMGQDLLQLINQGFNPLQVISKKTGESIVELKKRMEDGKISFEEVADAMKTAVSAGGQFYQAMEKQSRTMAGQWSTVMDNFSSKSGEIMKPVTDFITKTALPTMNKFMESFNTAPIVAELSKLTGKLTEVFKKDGVAGITSAMGEIIGALVTSAARFAPKLVEGALDIIKGLIAGLKENAAQIAQGAVSIITELVKGLLALAPSLVELGAKLVVELAKGIISGIPKLLGAFGELITGGNLLSKTIYVVIGAFVAFKAATLALSVISSITKVFAVAAANAHLLAAGATTAQLAQMGLSSSSIILGQVMVANTLKTKIATAVQLLWNAALKANPIALVVAGVVALTGAIIALVKWVERSNTETTQFYSRLQELLKSNKALQEAIADANKERAEEIKQVESEAEAARKLYTQIQTLIDIEDKSVGQKKLIHDAVAELNEIVPGLSLAYDENTDSLTKNNEEIEKQLALYSVQAKYEAQRKHFVELTEEQVRLDTELAAAEALINETRENSELSDKKKEKRIKLINASMADNIALLADNHRQLSVLDGAMTENADTLAEHEAAQKAAADAAEAETEALERQERRVKALSVRIDEHTKKIIEQSDRIKSLTSDLDSAERQYLDVASAQEYSAKTSANLTAEYGKLVMENGDLLAQYPHLYAAIDANATAQENSAEMAKAIWGIKKQLLIQELIAQKETVDSQILNIEKQRDRSLKAYEEIGMAAMFLNSTTKGLGFDVDFQSQLADAKKQAEQFQIAIQNITDLELDLPAPTSKDRDKITDPYRDAVDEIKRLRDLDKLDDADYYKAMEDARSKHLKKGSKEWEAAEVELYNLRKEMSGKSLDADKAILEERKKYTKTSLQEEYDYWLEVQEKYIEGSKERAEIDKTLFDLSAAIKKDAAETAVAGLEKAIGLAEEYNDALKDRSQEIEGYFGLFEKVSDLENVSGQDLITNLEKQNAALTAWFDSLDELAERGVDEGLMEQLRGMGPDAAAEVQAMLSLTEEDLTKYVELWRGKGELSRQQAEEELEGLKESTKTKIGELLTTADDELSETKTVGYEASIGLAEGILSGMDDVMAAAIEVAKAAVDAMKEELDIKSPSKVFKKQIGANIALGVAEGVEDETPGLLSRIKSGVTRMISTAREASFMPAQVAQSAYAGAGSATQSTPIINASIVVEPTGNWRGLVENMGLSIKRIDYLNGVKP